MTRVLRYWLLPPLSVVAACSAATEEMERPEDGNITSRVRRGGDGELMIAAPQSGGAAGDTVHRLLACPSAGRSCELLASVDANGQSRPELIAEGSTVAFIVNGTDYIGGFRNYSRTVRGFEPGVIVLRYRAADR